MHFDGFWRVWGHFAYFWNVCFGFLTCWHDIWKRVKQHVKIRETWMKTLFLFQDEPPRLLSASSWMTSEAGPSTRGEFVASTIDVDAIKVSLDQLSEYGYESIIFFIFATEISWTVWSAKQRTLDDHTGELGNHRTTKLKPFQKDHFSKWVRRRVWGFWFQWVRLQWIPFFRVWFMFKLFNVFQCN